MLIRFAFAGLLVVTAACIVPAPTKEGTKQGSTLPPAAPLQLNVGANLEDKVRIVSTVVNPGRMSPGEQARVLVNFEVLDEIGSDYLVFVHVEDVDGRMERLNADHQPAGGARPTSTWKKGEIIRDEFLVYLPPNVPVRGINVLLGLWEARTDHRMVLKNVNEVRHDNNNRILVAQIPVVAAE